MTRVRRDDPELERQDDRRARRGSRAPCSSARAAARSRTRRASRARSGRATLPTVMIEAVGQRAAERGVVPCRAEVGEVQLVRERERRLERLDVRLHRDHHQEVERDQPERSRRRSGRPRARTSTACSGASEPPLPGAEDDQLRDREHRDQHRQHERRARRRSRTGRRRTSACRSASPASPTRRRGRRP